MEFRAIKTDKLVESAKEVATDTTIVSRRLHQLTNCFLTKEQIRGKGYYSNGPLPRLIHRRMIMMSSAEYRKTHKEDRKEYLAEYRKEHKEEIRAYATEYNKAHKKEKQGYNVTYYQTHKAKRAEYYQKHKEERHIYDAEYRKAYKEERHTYNAEYRRTHGAEDAARHAGRRALKQRTISNATPEQLNEVKEIYRKAHDDEKVRCYLCGKLIPKGHRHVDHIIPLSKGGLHIPSNLAVACDECNLRKSAKMPEEIGLLI